nr:unnamed protein product [Callosobruchus analis]
MGNLYLGVEKSVQRKLSKYIDYDGDSISLRINVVGLHLFHSSNLQLWPILGLITNFRSPPFVIALFCGTSKPSSVELFFHDFIVKMNELMAQGYSACDKCTQSGQYIQGRIVMRSVDAQKRTDTEFKMMLDEDHHLGETPLLKLPIGLVSQFPID